MTADSGAKYLPLGTYHRTLDQQVRVTIPGIWRESPTFIDDTGYIVYRRPRRLVILPHNYVQDVLKGKYKKASRREKEDIRQFLLALHTVQLDSRGRMVIPYDLARALEISAGSPIVITASGEWVEIWRKDDWERGKGIKGLFSQ